MAGRKIIAICQSGGQFVTDKDGSLTYSGGDAHALDISEETCFDEFRSEIAEMWNCGIQGLTIKYFLPGNRRTLILISNDKDLKRMILFHASAVTVDVYVIPLDAVAHGVSEMPGSRSSRTAVSEALPPVEIPDDMHTMVDRTPVAINMTYENKGQNAARQWDNLITGANQRFDSAQEFREALRKYSIAHAFPYKLKKNDAHRVIAKCKSEGCPWRVYASRLSTTPFFCIRKMNPTHTCGGSAVTSGYQATTSLVASVIKEKLREFPNYKPKDIVEDLKRDYDIDLKYAQAWRGKEVAREQLQGSYEEAYSQLPYFCEKLMESNPGSLATFTTKEDCSFHCLFVSFYASIRGFNQGCRPLLFLDSTPLNSKYQGTLLAATAADGNNDVFPVAFAVVDSETDENWHWFLTQLRTAVTTSRPITFVADIKKGLRDSIPEVFENSFHSYCLHYLSENFKKVSHEVKCLLVAEFSHAASVTSLEGFQRSMDSIKSISPEAYSWVLKLQPKHWANAYFGGARYNHMTSKFGDFFYSWVSEAHELPITQVIDVIRGKITDLFNSRRKDCDQWLTRITPRMEEKLLNLAIKARSLEVLFSPGNIFEVRDDFLYVVDLDHGDCNCKEWQIYGLPCCHAIAVLEYLGRHPHDYCSRQYTIDNYRLTYSESISSMPILEQPVKLAESLSLIKVTPPSRRAPGRPKMKQVGSQTIIKRQIQCSKCKSLGHNKISCKEFLLEG